MPCSSRQVACPNLSGNAGFSPCNAASRTPAPCDSVHQALSLDASKCTTTATRQQQHRAAHQAERARPGSGRPAAGRPRATSLRVSHASKPTRTPRRRTPARSRPHSASSRPDRRSAASAAASSARATAPPRRPRPSRPPKSPRTPVRARRPSSIDTASTATSNPVERGHVAARAYKLRTAAGKAKPLILPAALSASARRGEGADTHTRALPSAVFGHVGVGLQAGSFELLAHLARLGRIGEGADLDHEAAVVVAAAADGGRACLRAAPGPGRASSTACRLRRRLGFGLGFRLGLGLRLRASAWVRASAPAWPLAWRPAWAPARVRRPASPRPACPAGLAAVGRLGDHAAAGAAGGGGDRLVGARCGGGGRRRQRQRLGLVAVGNLDRDVDRDRARLGVEQQRESRPRRSAPARRRRSAGGGRGGASPRCSPPARRRRCCALRCLRTACAELEERHEIRFLRCSAG